MVLVLFVTLLPLLLITGSTAISACDQNFTASVGEISSPNFPSYPTSSSITCRYRISAPAGERIHLSFQPHPDLTDNNGCQQSSLRIVEDKNASLQYCSSTQTCHKAYLSNGTSLLFVYTTNSQSTSLRFRLVYRIISGYTMDYNRKEGMIYSPNFMNKLLDESRTYIYRIEAAAGMKISLSFSYFNLHDDVNCSVMSFSIYEGTNSNGIPLERRCGRNVTEFVSVSNRITVTYTTNGNTAAFPVNHGFKIYYASGTQGCTKFYTSPSGTIYSPLYPSEIPNNTVCTYNITVYKGNMIQFLNPSYYWWYNQYLQLFERDPTSGKLMELDRRYIYQYPYYSLSRSLLLRLKSHSSPSHLNRRFRTQYHAAKGCSVTLTAPYHYITSPQYPDTYPKNIICNYTLKYNTSINYHPAIYFLLIDIKESQSCNEGSVSVYDGKDTNGILLDKLCSTKGIKYYGASTDTLFIQFRTSNVSSGMGFFAYFTSRYSGSCSQSYYYPTTILSPNYPERYPNSTSCSYYLSSYNGNAIVLRMQHFDLESSRNCNKDSLEIYEGSTLMSKRCGNDTSQYVSRSNNLRLLFTSDATTARTGFHIQSTDCGGWNHWPYYQQHLIQSPGYPDAYTENAICRHYLYGGFRSFGIRLEFNAFDLEESQGCQNDNLTIYNGSSSGSPILAILCGSVSGDLFFQSQYLLAAFRSNSNINKKGFSIKVDPCSKLFTNDTGTVTSPGFPSRTPRETICTYAIRLQKGARIQLVFQNFSLSEHYAGNGLQVYDGRNSSAPLIATMRGSSYWNVYATGNEVFMKLRSFQRYISDANWYGFQLNYYDNQENCLRKPCKNNATCTELSGKYRCNCPVDYRGKNCEEKIVPCKSYPCLNNGTCSNIYSDKAPTYKCTCLDEYIGNTCGQFVVPCLNYIAEEKWQRSNQSLFDSKSMSPLCDLSITEAWYRFTSKAGGIIPQACPAVNSCGTTNSIWANGSLPLSIGNSKSVTACVRNEDSCCSEQWPIRIRRCSVNGTEYFVYKLPPSPRCPMAYCAGSEIPCPDGLSSMTGFTPCNDKVPRLKSDPKLSVSHENGRIMFACKYDVDTKTDQMNIEVTWYQGNSTNAIHKENIQWWKRQATLQNKKNAKPIFRLGTTIYCKVRGWYGTYRGIASRYYESNHFYAGILVAPRMLYERITEGGPPLKINLTSTVPVVCPGNDECSVQVQLVHDTSEILSTACSVIFKKDISAHTIEIYGKRDFIDDGDKVVTIKISIVGSPNLPDWQNHEEFSNIQVEVKDVGTARCSSNGDPRLFTFDNLYYGHFQPGDHVFVKSLSRVFEVHVRTWQCSWVTCNCGIAAREGDDVIIIDMCFDGIPRVRFASKKTPAEGTIVKRDPTGKSFIIKFPSGAFIRVDNFGWFGGRFANFIVQIPSDDFASTRGLCGTFDYNSRNEMLSKDGRYYDDPNYRRYVAPLEFTESWKIPVWKSLFYHRATNTNCPKNEKKTYCDCKGDPQKKDGVNRKTYDKISQPPEFQELGWKELRYGGSNCKKRKRRSVEDVIILPEDDEGVGYVYDPKPLPNITIAWPTKSGKTEAQVTNYCNKTIRESAPGRICAKISDFNFTSFLLQCIDDIKITDNYDFSSSAVRAMQDACEEVFLRNTSYWEKDPASNGSLVPPKEMADTLCPGLCSGHGKCEKGKCNCDANYTSADCSVDKRKGPTVVSIPGNGTCDVSNRSDCHLTRITGYDFIDSGTLSCRVAKVMTGGKQSEESSIGRSYLLSFLEVMCDLGQHSVKSIGDPFNSSSFTHAIYELQISNDKKVFSKKKLSYIIYNSKCMECDINALKCSQKPSTCIINGYCFNDGEKYSSDPCFVCKPTISTSKFTASCKVSDKEKKSYLTLIVSTTAGSVALILLIVILACIHAVRKRGKAKISQKKQANRARASFDNQAYGFN